MLIYIYHNAGLGDHIIFNGLARRIADKYDKAYVFCKHRNLAQVNYMFRDTNIQGLPFHGDIHAQGFVDIYPHLNILVLHKHTRKAAFDRETYQLANIDFRHKWDSFYVERDYNREATLYDMYNIKEEYVFIHDDPIRNFVIHDIPGIRCVRPDKCLPYTIFDYFKIIENAKAVHCIDSSFFNLIDCSMVRTNNIVFHKYARKSGWNTPAYNRYWEVLA